MRPLVSLLPFDEALEVVEKNIKPVNETEVIPIDTAVGRVLAADIIATHNTPPFDRGAMDGYAVIAEDTQGASREKPAVLEMIGVIHAGDLPEGSIKSGQCMQIATGAMMPEGADAVVMVEDTSIADGRVSIYKGAAPLSNVGLKGEDIKAGEMVLNAGSYLDAGKVGVLASQGLENVKVYIKPRIAVMPSGEEVVELGKELKPGQLYDINSYSILSVVNDNGGVPFRPGIIGDNIEDIRAKLTEAVKKSDCLVFSGGSSAGEKDLISTVAEELGVILFHGVEIRPGKPTMFAIINDKPVFGMPGYPTSALVNSYLFLVPALRKMARLPRKRAEKVKAKLSRTTSGSKDRPMFMTVKLEGDEAVPVFTQSGAIMSIARADGYFKIEANSSVEKGEEVTVTLF
ncbi:MAG: molybdopterin molybdotransferase MoeA [Dehalococcoidales bacterium]|nr:MAG: molybdopterin molybdotransferase MoeA [Dehalococcoidales bacterium]